MLEPENGIRSHVTARVGVSLGELERAVGVRLSAMDAEDYPKRLLAKDTSLWSRDPSIQEAVGKRLGWIGLEDKARDSVDDLTSWVGDLHDKGVRQAVLLGMGGSSLCPLVFRESLYEGPPNIDLTVLDLIHPAAVADVEDIFRKPSEAVFLVSSKSGTTIETLSFYQYFSERFAPDQFVAVTDPGTPLEKLAQDCGFGRVFEAPPDLGGRYSAFSAFGLVPAALMGLKVRRLLDRARAMYTACAAKGRRSAERPGLWLGAVLAEAALAGRDKLTFFISPEIASVGTWFDQLVAESTGKDGKGILPVVGEEISEPEAYGDDRLFVHLRLPGDAGSATEKMVDDLESAGHPVVRFYLDDPYDLGCEMLRWMFATAVAGAILRVNPFDEPNVTDAKTRTKQLLEAYEREGELPEPAPSVMDGDLRLFADEDLRRLAVDGAVSDWLAAHLGRLRKGDYFSILAYLPESPAVEQSLRNLQKRVRDATGVPVTVGYGPRYLHSTGQLHKGGPNTGSFLLLTVDSKQDLPIPGKSYSFGVLERAQAIGDEQALRDNGRRVARCHLGAAGAEKGLGLLGRRMLAAMAGVKKVF